METLTETIDAIWEIMRNGDDDDFETMIYESLTKERQIDHDLTGGDFKASGIKIAEEIITELYTYGKQHALEHLSEKMEWFDYLVEERRKICRHPRWATEVIDWQLHVGMIECKRCGATWIENIGEEYEK